MRLSAAVIGQLIQAPFHMVQWEETISDLQEKIEKLKTQLEYHKKETTEKLKKKDDEITTRDKAVTREKAAVQGDQLIVDDCTLNSSDFSSMWWLLLLIPVAVLGLVDLEYTHCDSSHHPSRIRSFGTRVQQHPYSQ
eukprot:gene1129-1686_t